MCEEIHTFSFLPVRFASTTPNPQGAVFQPDGNPLTFTDAGENWLGGGGYAQSYKVELPPSEKERMSFTHILLDRSTGGIVTDSDYHSVTQAAIKVARLTLTEQERATLFGPDTNDTIAYNRTKLNDFIDEYERMLCANGANGHLPKPYALGWVTHEDGNLSPAILMEYCPSQRLNEHCTPKSLLDKYKTETVIVCANQLTALSTLQTVEVGIELCKALRCLHDTGICHRDISLGNTLIRFRRVGDEAVPDKVYIVDLGSSTRTGDELSIRMDGDSISESLDGQRWATAGFGAPEVFSTIKEWEYFSWRNENKVDVYEAAAILYALRTNSPQGFPHLPFNQDDVDNWMKSANKPGGFSLSDLYRSADDRKLSDVIQSCSILQPEYRRDVGWMMAELWDLANSMSDRPRNHYADYVCPINTYAYDCLVNGFEDDILAVCHSPLNETTRQEIKNASQSTQPYSQDPATASSHNAQSAPAHVHVMRYVAPQHHAMRTSSNSIDITALISSYDNSSKSPNTNSQKTVDAVTWYDLAMNRPLDPHDPRDNAFFWLDKAAREGHPKAYIYLAMLNRDPRFTRQINLKAAIYYLSSAVERGCTEALGCLGAMVCLGEGVDEDSNGAARLLLKGFEDGDALCAHNLAVLFWRRYEQCGKDTDAQETVRYLISAVEYGYSDDSNRLWHVCNLLKWPDWIDTVKVNQLVNSAPTPKAGTVIDFEWWIDPKYGSIPTLWN